MLFWVITVADERVSRILLCKALSLVRDPQTRSVRLRLSPWHGERVGAYIKRVTP